MNAAVGNGPKYSVSNFGWNASQWYVASKSTDFNNPGPSRTWVFTDEHPDSIDDALIYTAPFPTTMFTELLANQHDGAARHHVRRWPCRDAQMDWRRASESACSISYNLQRRLQHYRSGHGLAGPAYASAAVTRLLKFKSRSPRRRFSRSSIPQTPVRRLWAAIAGIVPCSIARRTSRRCRAARVQGARTDRRYCSG